MRLTRTNLADLLPAAALGRVEDLPAALRADATVEGVARPGTVDEVAGVLRWASRAGVRVVPIGTGRHLPRSRACGRCIVLSLDRMTGMELYEPADLTFTAAAGTPVGALARELGHHRQWLPFDPPDADERSLGGLVATGLGGPLGSGWYGDLRNHVLGAVAVFGDGRVLRLGGRVVKNVAGFDLLRPLVGSHGSLAVMASVCMRVFPVPEIDRMLVLRGASVEALADAARTVASAAVVPASVLLVAGSDAVEGGAGLAVRLHGARTTVDADQRAIERLVGVACDAFEGDEAARLAVALRDHPRHEAGTGALTVLPDRVGPALKALARAFGAAPAFAAEPFGGRIRFAFDVDDLPAFAPLRQAIEEMGGSLGVERLPGAGEGREVAAIVDRMVSVPTAAESALADRIRSVFDPAGVLQREAAAPAAVEVLA